jgi:CPA2 family monovalent cation:H+ antiporter-2
LSLAAQIGALLLLFLLGLEYSVREIGTALRQNKSTGLMDLLNFLPGLAIGFVLGWGWVGAVALAGITYASSSGIASQLIRETGWQRSELAKRTVSVLVLEDLVMAPFLPLITALAAGISFASGFITVGIAILVTALVLVIGARNENWIGKVLNAREPNALLLTVFGLALLAGGLATYFGFSSAVAAFLVGLLMTGELAQAVRARMAPLRDLFAALFFLFFGLGTNPNTVAPLLPAIIALAVMSSAFKLLTGWWAAKPLSGSSQGLRIGAFLVPRGEFSIVIAGLVATSNFPGNIEALTLGYVILTAFIGSILLYFIRSPLEKLK